MEIFAFDISTSLLLRYDSPFEKKNLVRMAKASNVECDFRIVLFFCFGTHYSPMEFRMYHFEIFNGCAIYSNILSLYLDSLPLCAFSEANASEKHLQQVYFISFQNQNIDYNA